MTKAQDIILGYLVDQMYDTLPGTLALNAGHNSLFLS